MTLTQVLQLERFGRTYVATKFPNRVLILASDHQTSILPRKKASSVYARIQITLHESPPCGPGCRRTFNAKQNNIPGRILSCILTLPCMARTSPPRTPQSTYLTTIEVTPQQHSRTKATLHISILARGGSEQGTLPGHLTGMGYQ